MTFGPLLFLSGLGYPLNVGHPSMSFSFPATLFFSLIYHYDGCLLLLLPYIYGLKADLPAVGVVYILELTTNNGISWMP